MANKKANGKKGAPAPAKNTPQQADTVGKDAVTGNDAAQAAAPQQAQAPQEIVNAASGVAGGMNSIEYMLKRLELAGVIVTDIRDIEAWDDETVQDVNEWANAATAFMTGADVSVPEIPAAVTSLIEKALPKGAANNPAANTSSKIPGKERPALFVRTKARNGRRRRAGLVFTGKPYGIDLDALTAEQIAAIKADKMLVVEEVTYPADEASA